MKIWRRRLRRRKIVSLETFSNYVRSDHEKIPMTCSDICLYPVTEQWSQRQINLEFFFKDFFGKCDPIGSFLRIQSHLLKKSLMENFIFHAVEVTLTILLNTTSQTPFKWSTSTMKTPEQCSNSIQSQQYRHQKNIIIDVSLMSLLLLTLTRHRKFLWYLYC